MRRSLYLVLGAGMALSGCTMGPDYQSPPVAKLAPAWAAPQPHGGQGGSLLGWWGQFNDPTLTRLQRMAEADSPTLDRALARIDSARATLTSSRSALFPAVNANAGDTRSRQAVAGNGVISENRNGRLDASWELDLFGKNRRTAEAADARIQARTDEWHDARVSLAAEVADYYVQYRGCTLLAAAYDQQAQSQQSTIDLTRIKEEAGFTAPGDRALADASAAQSRSQAAQQRGQCELLVKSLVSISGGDEPAVRQMLADGQGALPQPAQLSITQLPADLIRQRPDVAALEREVAASNAEIGAAIADRLPSLSLTGSIGMADSGNGSATTWSYGPSLSLPLFDAGRRAAAVTRAEAAYAQAVASYRVQVRSAVLEVEQTLVKLDTSTRRQADAARAADGYQRHFQAIDASWQAGNASLLDREQARRSALDADISLINLRQEQVRSWIALYKAAGGGWHLEGGQ
ncbi:MULTISPECIES: efflux transporter outer membrane subunit [unclassified Azospirillum]|uniref:efflux transporter outer membrane subunit n=1 Tax=unclassified Azospirillum TaxID=2630922 RepID=UPI000B6F8D37|nr:MULTISPECIES: efflux transporter outer membrane subunit [unclassified Azospirillum]SNR99764.1 efflux transporter, outer membrane factor (OMF) lipoprotein, NodT family [Azospirillum sp. RU38E]SNS17308.1 efflux transporter, outer membrane factor (OMF) lipoprotein, NodT family [Azospirillum sp. RU37A]